MANNQKVLIQKKSLVGFFYKYLVKKVKSDRLNLDDEFQDIKSLYLYISS